jgi:hypothetical protein
MSDEQDEVESTSPQNDSTSENVPEPPPPPPNTLQMSDLIKGKDTQGRGLFWLKGLIDE